MSVRIVGAGLAGLLAGNMIPKSKIFEVQKEVPNNHHALLRFRTSIVGDTLGIPFREVQVMKASHSWKNPVADAMAYSRKTNGKYTLRSVTTAKGEIETRYIAPPDLIARMAEPLTDAGRIAFGAGFFQSPEFKNFVNDRPIISTIPMPILMEWLGWNVPGRANTEFDYKPGWTISANVPDADACATVYVPDPGKPFYRISLTGQLLQIEGNHWRAGWRDACEVGTPAAIPRHVKSDLVEVLEDAYSMMGLGIPNDGFHSFVTGEARIRAQKYSKILPIPEDERRRFILWATEKHNIFSLGRFATWRPGLLMDDLVKDIRWIQRAIREREAGTYTTYDEAKR